jgi:hypothetical protein
MPASHHGSLGQVMWDLWLTKRHWADFLRVLQFPLPLIHYINAPQSSMTGTTGQQMAAVIVELVPLSSKDK